MLEKEFDYYLNNQKTLADKYQSKYIVIVGDQIEGAYESFETALYESKKTMQQGTFLIQHCINGSVAYTNTFHSNVFFEDVTN